MLINKFQIYITFCQFNAKNGLFIISIDNFSTSLPAIILILKSFHLEEPIRLDNQVYLGRRPEKDLWDIVVKIIKLSILAV